jgi:hypothetical protein
VYTFILFTLVLTTNQYFSFADATTIMGQSDMLSYREIAMSAPYLPSHQIQYHHAQRAYFQYTIGSISNYFGLDTDIVVLCCNLFLLICLLCVFMFALSKIGLNTKTTLLLLVALVSLNPYITRYFSVFYYMISDTLFIFGFMIVVFGFISRNLNIVLLGVIVAAFGRQTALLLLPAVIVYIYIFSFSYREA